MKDFAVKFGKYVLAVVIAVILFVSGSVTDIGQLLGYAIDPQKAVARAVEIVNTTPKDELIEAVKEETKE